MVRYRRNFVAGGAFFFTVTLADRTSQALTDHITDLRTALRQERHSHPFVIDAIVVLPDHLHMVMTLPDGDADYPNRWRLIKRRFTEAVLQSQTPIARHQNGELACGSADFGNTPSAIQAISSDTSITFISIPSSTALSRVSAIGLFPRFTDLCEKDCCRRT